MIIATTHLYAGRGSAAAVDHVVDFSFSVNNTGLLSLFNVAVQSTYLESRGSLITCVDDTDKFVRIGLHPGSVSAMASYPDNGLTPGGSIACTASIGVVQAEVSWSICMWYVVQFILRQNTKHECCNALGVDFLRYRPSGYLTSRIARCAQWDLGNPAHTLVSVGSW